MSIQQTILIIIWEIKLEGEDVKQEEEVQQEEEANQEVKQDEEVKQEDEEVKQEYEEVKQEETKQAKTKTKAKPDATTKNETWYRNWINKGRKQRLGRHQQPIVYTFIQDW